MRRVRLQAAIALLIPGCTVLPWLPIEPPSGQVIVGGIADVRPYFGTLRSMANADVGEMMLASCGCGDWRILCETQDGAEKWQFPVQFYSPTGIEDPLAVVTLYGREDDAAAAAMLSQAVGRLEGRAERGPRRYTFTATRGETHGDDARACVKCHIGEDPIWPQSPGHPTFELNPPNCLSCHSVVIRE